MCKCQGFRSHLLPCPLMGLFPAFCLCAHRGRGLASGKRASWPLSGHSPREARRGWARNPKLHWCELHLLESCIPTRHGPVFGGRGAGYVSCVHCTFWVFCPQEAALSRYSLSECVHIAPCSPLAFLSSQSSYVCTVST